MHAMPMGLPGPAEISSGAGGHQNVRNVIFLGQRMIMMMQQPTCASCTTHRGKYYRTSRYVYSVLKKYPSTGIPCTAVRVFGIRFKKFLLRGTLRINPPNNKLEHTTRTRSTAVRVFGLKSSPV